MRFVSAASATMNSTTPSTRPSTMDTAISFLPNSASSSMNDFFSTSFGAGSWTGAEEAGSSTSSSVLWAPSPSITVSGRPKSSFQENAFSPPSPPPPASEGPSPSRSAAGFPADESDDGDPSTRGPENLKRVPHEPNSPAGCSCSRTVRAADPSDPLGSNPLFVRFVRERVQRRDLESLVA